MHRHHFALPCVVALVVSSCGSPERDLSVLSTGAPIIGGTSDTTHTWVVGIDVGGSGICSGSLIAPNLVLTARHCVSKTPEKLNCEPGSKVVQVSSNYAANTFQITTNQNIGRGPASQVWRAKQVYYPNDALCTTDTSNPACHLCGFDLALIELQANSTGFPTTFTPPSLVPARRLRPYNAIGYGCQKDVSKGCSPVGTRMMLDDVRANQILDNDVYVEGRVCGGDSGGPLFDPATNVVLGALSRGDGATATAEGCNFGVYTRTDPHLAWLQKYATLAAGHGGYTAPPWVSATAPVDAGPVDTGPPPPKKPIGETCTSPAECKDNVCVALDGAQRCSIACSDTRRCPRGYDCLSGFCWASAPIVDAGVPDTNAEDTGESDVATDVVTTTQSGACSVASADSPPPKPMPWIVSGFGLALAIFSRRKRR